MDSRAVLLASLAFVSLAAAQPVAEGTVDRVLHFTAPRTELAGEEIATVISSIADIKQVSIDSKENALVLHGTAGQIALADWLFPLLEQPIQQDPAKHEYRISVNPDDVVRVFYLANAATVQNFQEIATAVRSVADIRRMFTYNEPKAIVVRGTADQAALAEFLFSEIDKPSIGPVSSQPSRSSAIYTYRPDTQEGVLKVFYLPQTKTVADFQEINLVIRTITRARRLFTYNAPRAVIVRGSADQIALADWMFNELSQPANPQDAGPHEYRLAAASDEVVEVFLTHAQTAQRLQEITMQIRSATKDPDTVPYNASRAVVVRGTAAQISRAGLVIKEQDR
ncbi:MAG TPA: hypothetical protein VH157_05700 [Bryobacteraceae bacterium]|nr:hypothetical protein [Bryobacteraceae bacterium]